MIPPPSTGDSGDDTPDYAEALQACRNFGDVFELVKRSVEETLHQRRAGLMLYLADLPLAVGAYHEVGSNTIVVNSALLKMVEGRAKSREEVNAYLYSILLHEYLHALGYIEEAKVRRLVYLVSKDILGPEHPATRMAANPTVIASQIPPIHHRPTGAAELVRDFDRPDHHYII